MSNLSKKLKKNYLDLNQKSRKIPHHEEKNTQFLHIRKTQHKLLITSKVRYWRDILRHPLPVGFTEEQLTWLTTSASPTWQTMELSSGTQQADAENTRQ